MTVTRFDGATLPAGWTAVEPAAGHVTTGAGYLSLATDAGADYDSLSSGTTVPEGPRVGFAVTGDFDYAVHLITPINCAPNIGIDLLAWDQANTQGIRFAHYVSGITGRDGNFFGRRQTPSANNNITLTATPSNLYGPRQWLRMRRVAATNTWTLMSSHTGKPGTWHTHANFTNSFAQTSFEIAMTAVSPDGVGREIRIYSVVDMAGRSDDATTPAPTPAGPDIPTLTPNLTGPALPAELTGTTNAGGSISVDLGVMTLTTDSNVADSYAWVEADVPHDGLTCMFRFPGTQVQNTFGAIVLHSRKTTDIPRAAVKPDKYRPGTGILLEVNGDDSFGDIVRVLDAHIVSSDSNYDASSAMEFYGFALKNENLTAPVDGSLGSWIRMRFEHRDGYYRLRLWYDGDAEPSTWQYEGEDHSQFGTGLAFVMAHNDSTTGGAGGTSSMDVSSIQAYNIDEGGSEPEPRIRLGNGHGARMYRLSGVELVEIDPRAFVP